MVMDFIADYIDKSGNFLHAPFQTLTLKPVDKHVVALGACAQLRERGFTPLLIVYVPGEHSPEELEEIARHGPIGNLETVYRATICSPR